MAKVFAVGEAHDLLDERLSALVGGMRFTGDDELDRPVVVEQQVGQPLRIPQHQRQPLVRGNPASEADGQHVRIESRWDPAQLGVGGTALQAGTAQPGPHVLDQLRSQLVSDPPQMTRVDLLQPRPGLHLAQLGQVLAAEQFAAELDPLRGRPGRRVHPVGDRSDRHLGRVEPRPQFVEHLAAHAAVQQRDAVGALREPQAHVRHVELRRVVFGAEGEDALKRHARQQPGTADRCLLGSGPEVALHHLGRETVDARGHRCVGGEHRRRPHHGQRGVEVEAGLDELTDPLGAEEAGVALVHMEHLGCGKPLDLGERPDRPNPADPGQDLLLDPVFLVATVEPVGDGAQVVLVLRDVGIQQQQRDSADLRDPYLSVELCVVGQGELDQHRGAGLVGKQSQRQTLRIERGIALVLPAVGRQ